MTALTYRQREVAALVAEGCTNAEIARRLYVSPATVKAELARVCEALGVRSRAEVAREVGRTTA